MFSIEICNRQTALEFDAECLQRAATAVMRDAGILDATLSIALVDDPTMHQLNRRYLDHDYPTDVLSFVLERDGERLEGEVIVSCDTALRAAQQLGWPAGAELLLYVIHGTLHLVGHDDRDAESRIAMRDAERRYLALFDLEPREEPP